MAVIVQKWPQDESPSWGPGTRDRDELPLQPARGALSGASPCASGRAGCPVPCVACRALVDEVEHDVTKAGHQKIQVGSSRTDPAGRARGRR